MLFHSAAFAACFTVLYLIYGVLNHSRQNVLLLIFSYFFYGAWNFKLLPLLIFSTSVDYFSSRVITQTHSTGLKRLLLMLSLGCNLSLLGFFKYYNFFIESFNQLFLNLGLNLNIQTLNIILPIGISFYTFQTMSYTIDVYKGIQKAEKNFISFALFVSFFPQLIAGPIERARSLLTQINHPREISHENLGEGFYLFILGLYKKIFIADNLALIVEAVYDTRIADQNGLLVLIGGCAFALQVYCDFAGYSEMARGLARMIGFRLTVNFKEPFFSKNPRELWSRWHISLSNWFRDYVFVPIAKMMRIKHMGLLTGILVAFSLSGLWHGANWTFVAWGLLNGVIVALYYLVNLIIKRIGMHHVVEKILNVPWIVVLRVALTFFIFVVGGLIFRSESLSHIFALSALRPFGFPVTFNF